MEEIEVLKKHYLSGMRILATSTSTGRYANVFYHLLASGVHPMRLVLETKKL